MLLRFGGAGPLLLSVLLSSPCLFLLLLPSSPPPHSSCLLFFIPYIDSRLPHVAGFGEDAYFSHLLDTMEMPPLLRSRSAGVKLRES